MPVEIRKRKGKKCYSVVTPGGVKAKCTSRRKAIRQERLLNALEHNPRFKPRSRRRGM